MPNLRTYPTLNITVSSVMYQLSPKRKQCLLSFQSIDQFTLQHPHGQSHHTQSRPDASPCSVRVRSRAWPRRPDTADTWGRSVRPDSRRGAAPRTARGAGRAAARRATTRSRSPPQRHWRRRDTAQRGEREWMRRASGQCGYIGNGSCVWR